MERTKYVWGASLALCVAACGQGQVREEATAIMLQGIGGTGFGGRGGSLVTQVGVDTHIVENDLTNYSTATRITVRGDSTSGTQPISVGLVQWQPLPGGGSCTSVTSAYVELTVKSTSTQSFRLYGGNRNWVHTSANWTRAWNGSEWEVPGAMGVTDRGDFLGEFTPSSQGDLLVVLNNAGRLLVQTWLTHSSGWNQGMIIGRDTGGDGFSFASFDDPTVGSRPKLIYHCN